MNKNITDWYQELSGFSKTPSTVGNNPQRSNSHGHQSSKPVQKTPKSIENKHEVVERLIKFLSADC
jgi:hypothetical protein